MTSGAASPPGRLPPAPVPRAPAQPAASPLPKVAQALCAALFSDGGDIEHARAHAIAAGPFVVAPHAHRSLVQFDWIVHCRGQVTVDGRRTALSGSACALVLVAPRVEHAMRLEPSAESADSRVYHARLTIGSRDRGALRGASRVVAGLPLHPSVEAALNDVWRLTVGGVRRPLLRKAKLAEAIALLPGASADADGAAAPAAPGGFDRDLDAAIRLMERSLAGPPPTLDALADAAHLSVRHFTRRFRDALGIPPIEFLDRKRLALAQQMLAYESAGVGEVAQRMGFSSPAVFSRWFANLAKETPSAYRSRPHAL